jgi:hypothetical protein
MRSVNLALLSLFTTAACGDPMVSGDFEGDARVSLHGIICGNDTTVPMAQAAVGVVWVTESGPMIAAADVERILEHRLPIDFELSLFDAAPGSMQIGIPIFFDDVDRNGSFTSQGGAVDAPDRLLGVSSLRVITRIGEGFQVSDALCSAGEDEIEDLVPAPGGAAVDITLLPAFASATSEDPPASPCLRSMLER